MNDIYIGAYWGPRRETVSSCASRAKKMFLSLASYSGVFSQWYELGRSHKDALRRPLDINNDEKITEILQKGRGKRDDDKSTIKDLGFRIGLWNGENEQVSASISIRCGLYVDNPNLSNSVVLNLPENLVSLIETAKLLPVFSAIVESWEPERAGVISRKSRDTRNYHARATLVDWMVYVQDKAFDPSTLLKPSVAYKVGQLGWIIVVQESPIQLDNPDHLRNVRAVKKCLGITP